MSQYRPNAAPMQFAPSNYSPSGIMFDPSGATVLVRAVPVPGSGQYLFGVLYIELPEPPSIGDTITFTPDGAAVGMTVRVAYVEAEALEVRTLQNPTTPTTINTYACYVSVL